MKLTNFLIDMGRVVAYYPNLKKVTGSTTASILLCQFLYWSEKSKDKPWTYKTSDEIEEETGLTYNEQKTAKKKLVALGILKVVVKRLDHTSGYKINYDKLNEAWDRVYQTEQLPKEEKKELLPVKEEPKIEVKKEEPVKERQRNSDVPKRGDFVDAILEFGVFSPAAKKADDKMEIKRKIEEKLSICADGTRWEKFIDYAYTRQSKYKESIDVFLDWALNNGFDPIYWTPEKLKTVFPTAIEEYKKKNQPSKNFIQELPKIEEKEYAPMPKDMGIERKLY